MKKQPAMTDGIKSLLGVDQPTPSEEIRKSETPLEREAREQEARDNMRRTLRAGTPQGDYESELEELNAALAEAEKVRDEAAKAIQEATRNYNEKRDAVDRLKNKIAAADTRSEAEIVKELIRKNHERRMNEATRTREHLDMLLNSGVVTPEEARQLAGPKLSPADIRIQHEVKARRHA